MARHGGDWRTWGINEAAGMMCRELLYKPIESYYVASSNILISIEYYTDFHYVDEDMSAIPAQGGQLDCGSYVGIANRDTNNAPTDVRNSVASYV